MKKNKKGQQEGNSQKLLIPKYDVVFQALFGVKGSEPILEGLLSKILGKEVENVTLDANQNLVRETPNQKLGILDLIANIGKTMEVNIELQLVDYHYMLERLLYYWSRVYGKQLNENEDYGNLKKTIAILITDYEFEELKEIKDSHTEWQLREKRNPNILIFKNIEIHIIEMPKVLKYKEETEKGLSMWIEFLLNPESELVKMRVKEDKKLKVAYEKLEYISGDARLRRIAELRRKYKLDQNTIRAERRICREEGREEGRAEGRKVGERLGRKLGKQEKAIEIAKKLLEMQMPIEKIAKITELTEKEIEDLK